MASHIDVIQMLDDLVQFVSQHPGATVLSADDPKWRTIGFSAFSSLEEPKHFNIALVRLKETIPTDEPLRSMICSAEGRVELAAIIERFAHYDLDAHMRRPTAWKHLGDDELT